MESHLKGPILIIDDDIEVVEAIEDTLRFGGFEVYKTTKPLEALGLLETVKPRLVILDVRMPELDGFSLLKKIKKKQCDIKVIVITGYYSECKEEIDHFKKLGLIQAAVAKPFNFSAFETLVNEVLETEEEEGGGRSRSRLLIVDDEEGVTGVLREMFHREGFNVALAHCVPEALRKFNAFKPHLLLVDLMLIGEDGFSLIEKIRKKNEKVIIYAMTAQRDDEVISRIHEICGEGRFFKKPFDLDKIGELSREFKKEIRKQ
ncbi:MAG: response regulator [Candidatus Omnitrophica bacterium]|nr:response regulator [Candidatus Omnitrophota bacterium]